MLIGPPGVFGVGLNHEDPRKRYYKDPGPGLERACGLLQGQLAIGVTPVLLFHRNVADYKNAHKRLKAFTVEQALSWLGSRQQFLDAFARQNVDGELRRHQSSHPS